MKKALLVRKFGTKSVSHKSSIAETVNFQKTKELDDEGTLHRFQGFGDGCLDMVANDFRYHRKQLLQI